jgi:hypothetical protein
LITENYSVDLQSELLAALDAVQSSGTFASFGTFPSLNLEVYLHDIGAILPLDESQARQLIGKSHQAPYGKGSETIVDTSVRDTWELNPEQFEVKNLEWGTYVKQIYLEPTSQRSRF